MKTLILYGSKHGCTEKCAYLLGERLGTADVVDLNKSCQIPLDAYDGVIIGSSVYAGQISKAVRQYCSANLAALQQKQLGLFVCCGQPEKAMSQLELGFPEELVQSAIIKGYFGYQLDMKKLNLLERLIVRALGRHKDELEIKHAAIESFADSFV